MHIQIIQIEKLNPKQDPKILRSEKIKEYEYLGIAIEDEGSYYYWSQGVSLKISEREFELVKSNPKLYYFSTALKLHCRIQKIKEAEILNDCI